MSGELGNLTVNVVAETGSFVASMDKATKSTEKLSKTTEKQRDSLEQLLGQIDPTISAYGRLDKMQQQLAKARASKMLDEAEFKRFTKLIEDQRAAVSRNADAYNANAKTARELAFATRNLPAQFTDIIVGIQGGQAPLTILLQQGGQIKDMFGGIVPAMKHLASYAVSLVSPFTVGIAAVGALAAGFIKAEAENSKFQKSLALTGQASGATSDQLHHLARVLDDTITTQSKASETLAQIVSYGKFTEDQFERIATAAIKFEKATGQAIETILDEFASLGKEPSSAIATLNEKYRFLTGSVYAQISALEEQGRVADAAALAEGEFSRMLEERSDKASDSANNLQKIWRTLVNTIKEAGDALPAAFRADTLEDQLDSLNRKIRSTEWGSGGAEAMTPQLIALRAERDAIQEQIHLRDDAARLAREQAEINEASVAAQRALNVDLRNSESNAEKLKRRYEEIDKLVEQARLGGREYTAEQIAILRAAAEEQFKDKIESARENAGERRLSELREQFALSRAMLDSTDKLSKAEQDLVRWNQEISDIKNKEIRTAEQQSLLDNEALITAQYEQNLETEKEISNRERINDLAKEFDKIMDSLRTKEEIQVALTAERLEKLKEIKSQLTPEQYDEALSRIVSGSISAAPEFTSKADGYSLSPEMRKLATAQSKLDEWYAQQIKILDENRQTQLEHSAKWNELEGELYLQYMLRTAEIAASEQAAKLEEANKQFEKFAKTAAKNIQNAFADFFFNPFEDGLKGMVSSFAKALLRIQAEAMGSQVTRLLLGGLASSANPFLSAVGVAAGGSAFVGPPLPRDSGGNARPGQPYYIGKGAQPELFIPDSAGTFIPNADKLGGGASTSINISIDARDEGAESRIRSMIQNELVPQIVNQAKGSTLASLKRPGFA